MERPNTFKFYGASWASVSKKAGIHQYFNTLQAAYTTTASRMRTRMCFTSTQHVTSGSYYEGAEKSLAL
jgi:hypothetical protein